MVVVATFLVAVVSYLLVVKSCRYRRLHAIHELCRPEESEKMTPALAQKILHVSFFYEVPTTMLLGNMVAMFKVWGIVSAV